jgi:hypothetical protein
MLFIAILVLKKIKLKHYTCDCENGTAIPHTIITRAKADDKMCLINFTKIKTPLLFIFESIRFVVGNHNAVRQPFLFEVNSLTYSRIYTVLSSITSSLSTIEVLDCKQNAGRTPFVEEVEP